MIAAAAKGDVDAIQTMLNSGVFIDVCGLNGGSALHYASFNDKSECVRYLINAGANVNAKASKMETPLHLASANGNVASIVELLGAPGINVNAVDDDGNTPIIYAYFNNHWDAVILLEDAGANTMIFFHDDEVITV